MSFDEPTVFLHLCAALVLLSLRWSARWRDACFLALNTLFVGIVYRASPSLLVLLGVLGIHYVVVRVQLRIADRRLRVALHWGWLLATLVGFVAVKRYYWLTDFFVPRDLLTGAPETLGYSFLLFRQIHLGVEVRDQALTGPIRLIDYVNYNLAFWTFLAGPVQRYEDFQAQLEQLGGAAPAREVLLGLNRALLGYAKMFLLGAWLHGQVGTESYLGDPSASGLIVLVLAYPLYLYINFSGYCDIVIGVARAVGFRLPENFRHPYLARNAMDFWARWHITLSEFFRDYLYFPVNTALARRTSPLLAIVTASLCSFVVMGAWHGNSARYALFGLLHALAVVAVVLYQRALKRMLKKQGVKRYMAHRGVSWGAVLCFQAYVVLTFLPFRYELPELMAVAEVTVGAVLG